MWKQWKCIDVELVKTVFVISSLSQHVNEGLTHCSKTLEGVKWAELRWGLDEASEKAPKEKAEEGKMSIVIVERNGRGEVERVEV